MVAAARVLVIYLYYRLFAYGLGDELVAGAAYVYVYLLRDI